jgi:hypothetical protein
MLPGQGAPDAPGFSWQDTAPDDPAPDTEFRQAAFAHCAGGGRGVDHHAAADLHRGDAAGGGIDRQTRDHEEAMVMRGLDLRMTELEQAITPQVDWDDAVIHMSDTMDAHWADSYYAGFMRNMLGATRAFVLDGETDSPMPRGMERAMTRPRPGPLRL